MQILHVASDIPTLSECLLANRTLERPRFGVDAKVIPQIATLRKGAVTIIKHALEEKFDSPSLLIHRFYTPIPFFRKITQTFIHMQHIAILYLIPRQYILRLLQTLFIFYLLFDFDDSFDYILHYNLCFEVHY